MSKFLLFKKENGNWIKLKEFATYIEPISIESFGYGSYELRGKLIKWFPFSLWMWRYHYIEPNPNVAVIFPPIHRDIRNKITEKPEELLLLIIENNLLKIFKFLKPHIKEIIYLVVGSLITYFVFKSLSLG